MVLLFDTFFGEAPPQNPRLASALFWKAAGDAQAKQTKAQALYQLAVMHQFALGLPGDANLAQDLLQRSLEADCSGWLPIALASAVLSLQTATCRALRRGWAVPALLRAASPLAGALGAGSAAETLARHWVDPAAGSCNEEAPGLGSALWGVVSGAARRVPWLLSEEAVVGEIEDVVRSIARHLGTLRGSRGAGVGLTAAEVAKWVEEAMRTDPRLRRSLHTLGLLLCGLSVAIWVAMGVYLMRTLRRRHVARREAPG